jgi:hypothetical protein
MNRKIQRSGNLERKMLIEIMVDQVRPEYRRRAPWMQLG